jgi:hypothetical protein
MPTSISCPGCQKALRVPDEALGKSILCPVCGMTFTPSTSPAGEAPPSPRTHPEPEKMAIAGKPALPRMPAAGARRFDPDDEDEALRRPAKKSSSGLLLILLLVGGGLLLVLGLGVLVIGGLLFSWVGMRKASAQQEAMAVRDEQAMKEQRWGQGGPPDMGPMMPGGLAEVEGPDVKGRMFFRHPGQVVSVTFTDEGKTLVGAADNGEVRFWDLAGAKLKFAIPPGHKEPITSMALSPDGKTVVTVSHGGIVQLMDVKTKQERVALSGLEQGGFSLWSVAYSSDNNTIATCHGNRVVRLWDVKAEKVRATFNDHTDQVSAAAFSPDGATLATGSWDKSVILWNVAEQRKLATLKPPGAEGGGIWALAFSPDGKTLAAGGNESLMRLWDVPNQNQRTVCRHLTDVTAIAFTKDGSLLASGDGAGAIRLWDPKTGKSRATMHTDRGRVGPNTLTFTPDGKKLAVACGTEVQLWDLSKVDMQ